VPSDYFLKLSGIKGESSDEKHKGEIELISFSWGLANLAAPAPGPGGGAGKVQFNDIHVTKRVSKASPSLFLACASGQHIPDGTLTVRRSGAKNQLEYLKYKFTDILVTGFQESGGGDDLPLDMVSFNFSKFEMTYTEQSSGGSPGATSKAGWDLKQNKKI
jgi:type VI secretion system secreted protein Hcp